MAEDGRNVALVVSQKCKMNKTAPFSPVHLSSRGKHISGSGVYKFVKFRFSLGISNFSSILISPSCVSCHQTLLHQSL